MPSYKVLNGDTNISLSLAKHIDTFEAATESIAIKKVRKDYKNEDVVLVGPKNKILWSAQRQYRY